MDTPAATPSPQALALCLAIAPLPHAAHTLWAMSQPNGVSVDSVFALYMGILGAVLLLSVPPLRRFAADLCAFLLQRIAAPVWLVLLVCLGLLATQAEFSGTWSGALSMCLPLAVIAECRAFRRSRLRAFVGTLLVLVFFASLVVLDQTLGALAMTKKSHNSIFLVHDEYLGWRLRPNFEVERKLDTYIARENTNSHGFRTKERPYQKPADTFRVVLLGDSHTEAYTVSNDQTYAVLLEQRLQALRGSAVEVISLGVGGFSTDQELLTYIHEGRRYEPDLVVLQFCPNDPPFNLLDRYWRGLKPHFERRGEHLLLQGVPVPDRRNSGLTNHVLLKQSNFAKIIEGVLARSALTKDVQKGDPEEAWRMTGLLILELASWVKDDGAKFAVFNSNPDDIEANSRIQALLAERSIAFIDIEPAFQGDIEAHRVEEDHHWNPQGHQVVAELLAARLHSLN